MKTLFLYALEFYLFCSCTCIFGYIQPHPIDSSSKLAYVENVVKKCKEVTVDVGKSDFLINDNLLCVGVNVLSRRFHSGLEENLNAAVETKYEGDICEHFHEMKLNSTQDKLNESAIDTYNLLFKDKSKCETLCFDVRRNVNPLCDVILLLSHSKGSPIVRSTPAPSTILSGGTVDNDNNEVFNPSRKIVNDDPNRSPDGQKTSDSYLEQVNVDQKAVSITQEKTVEKLKSHEGDKSARQDTVNMSHGTKSQATDHVGTIQQTDLTGVGSVEENPKPANEERTSFPELVKVQPSTNALPVERGNNIPDNNTAKKTTDSNKESKVTDVKDTSLSVDSNSVPKSDSLLQKKGKAQSSAVLPSNSDDDKDEKVTATSSKIQEKVGTVKDGLPSEKVVPNTGLKGDESISQVSNVEDDNGIVDSEKSQADNKETENASKKEVDLQTNLKITEETPKSNTNIQRIDQNNENVETAQDAEPAPQSGKSDTEKTTGDGGSFPSDTGDDVAESDLHISGDAGELNDNTEIYSGGGTGVGLDSDVFESGANINSNAGAVLFPERDIDDDDDDDDDSHFFAYFMTTMVFCIVGYLLFHNKQKILALALEGRARRGRRRPNTSGYRKLDSNLEEAISSSKSASVTQVIY